MTDMNLSSFIWSVADLLRGDYEQSEKAGANPEPFLLKKAGLTIDRYAARRCGCCRTPDRREA